LSRKKLANDVSGKPCLSTGNPPQTDICGDQENLGERISILEKAEAEMERQLTEQSAHNTQLVFVRSCALVSR
jgi:hypothetical protein